MFRYITACCLMWATQPRVPVESLSPQRPRDAARQADSVLRAYEFSGVAFVSRHGASLFQRAYGKASLEFDVDIRLDTRFRIGSITKLFTAVAVARLVESGRLDYDATIHRYLPEYVGAAGPSVTLQQLLTHTSGLANSDSVGSFEQAIAAGLPVYQLPATSAQIVQRHASGALVHTPGTHFDYNNADYFILGRIVERVTGEPFDVALKRLVLDPAELRSTGLMNWRAVSPVVATAYLRVEPGAPYIHELPAYFENWGAAGGMYSTGADLTRFGSALFDGTLLRPTSLQRLLTASLDEYAHGLWVAPITVRGASDRVAHRPGQVMGANTELVRYLDDGLTVILLSNTNATPMDKVAFEIARLFER